VKIKLILLLATAIILPILGLVSALPRSSRSQPGLSRFLKTKSGDPLKYDAKKDRLVTPTVQDIKNEIILAGQINAEKIATVKFQTSGYLTWVGVKIGDYVKKGQALASLDKRQLRKELARELNDYKTGLHNFNDVQDEYKETKERFLVTDEIQRILDRAQYTLNNTVIDYELDEITLKYATLTTPINGIVTDIEQPHTGINITPATAEITVIDPASIYFTAEIDEEDVITIKEDQKATITLDIAPQKTLNSQIIYISFIPISGQSSTVYEVRFSLNLDNSTPFYRLGMNGDATIITQQQDKVLTLPIEAIFENEDQKFVLIKKPGDLIDEKEIKTGIESDDFIQILEGVNPNDQIVIKKR